MPEELILLRQLREEVTRLGEALDLAIAKQEQAAAEEDAQKRRQQFRILTFPLGAGVAAASLRWAHGHSRTVAALATGAAATTAAVIVIAPPGVSDHASPSDHTSAAPAIAIPALPPIGHTDPPHIGPPKSGPPAPVPEQDTRPDTPTQHKRPHPLLGKPLAALVPRHPAKPVRSALPTMRPPVKPRELLPTRPGCRIRLRQTRLCLPDTGQN
jgi:hypothetical protein